MKHPEMTAPPLLAVTALFAASPDIPRTRLVKPVRRLFSGSNLLEDGTPERASAQTLVVAGATFYFQEPP